MVRFEPGEVGIRGGQRSRPLVGDLADAVEAGRDQGRQGAGIGVEHGGEEPGDQIDEFPSSLQHDHGVEKRTGGGVGSSL